jgi:rod shape determining protein RodA
MNYSLLRKINFKILIPAILLNIIGLLSISGLDFQGSNLFYFKRQLFFLIFSLFLSVLLSLIDLNFLKHNFSLILIFYFLFNLLLLFVLFFGKTVHGTKTWYQFWMFSFDPIFFAQIILILLLSSFFSKKHLEINSLKTILTSSFYPLVPFLLILLQPNLGSALTILVIWLGALIFSEIKMKNILILVLIGLVFFSLGWFYFLKDYQKNRILVFLNLKEDRYGISWNQNQSKIAIGSGKFFGKGIGKGSQTRYGFLPAARTDFIFSAIAEEMGFVGISILLFLFLILFVSLINIALKANSNFLKLLAGSFSFLILGETFINIGMCLGILPVIGIPLPFVSYGGSHLLASYSALGIILSFEKIDK